MNASIEHQRRVFVECERCVRHVVAILLACRIRLSDWDQTAVPLTPNQRFPCERFVRLAAGGTQGAADTLAAKKYNPLLHVAEATLVTSDIAQFAYQEGLGGIGASALGCGENCDRNADSSSA